jgi:hypothetical protein
MSGDNKNFEELNENLEEGISSSKKNILGGMYENVGEGEEELGKRSTIVELPFGRRGHDLVSFLQGKGNARNMSPWNMGNIHMRSYRTGNGNFTITFAKNGRSIDPWTKASIILVEKEGKIVNTTGGVEKVSKDLFKIHTGERVFLVDLFRCLWKNDYSEGMKYEECGSGEVLYF